MWNSLVIIFTLLLVLGCANTPTKTDDSLTYRQQLDIYKDMKVRLYKVSRPLKTNGADICSSSKYDNGTLTHSSFDYPERMRPIAQSYWGLAENPARLYTSHIRGDACLGNLRLNYEKQPNAHTDGESIFITPSLVGDLDDLALSLIIAHELGHIALGHVDMEPSVKLEWEADRFALFLLARAELDYRMVVKYDAANKRPHEREVPTHSDITKRAEHFRKVVLEIETLQMNGEDLVP